jgi:hypothetical protein
MNEDNDDYINYNNPFREEEANDMLNRLGGRTVNEAVEQKEVEDIYNGVMEGSGIGAEAVEERRPSRTDLRHSLLGGRLNIDTLRHVRDSVLDVYNSSRGATTDLFDETSNIMDMVNTMRDTLRLVPRESEGAGVLEESLGLAGATQMFEDALGISLDEVEGSNFNVNEMFNQALGIDIDDADLNDDDEISQTELNMAVNKTYETNAMLKQIHPLLLHALNNPYQNKRTIKKKTISTEQTGSASNQTNLVTQGYAQYDTDKNLYNVKY